ncbi:MAG: DNA repair protein RadA, partial [Betaproteobacteria bacterium]|nr:DNA repair protein RadA [Betaproteobacteria bacterium]
ERLREAAKLGFTQAIIPKANVPRLAVSGLEIIACDRVEDAVARLR